MKEEALTVRRNKDHIGDQIGDDTIVINTQTGAYYSLTVAAGALWAAAEKGETAVGKDIREVADALVAEGIFEAVNQAGTRGTFNSDIAYVKYTEMADILLADPIHEVDEDGWPKIR